MTFKSIIAFGTFILFLQVNSFGVENKRIDSLENLLKRRTGREKILILNELALELSTVDPLRAIVLAQQAYDHAVGIDEKELMWRALDCIGRSYFTLGELQKSVDYLNQSLEGFKALGNDLEVAKIYYNIGIAYLVHTDFDQAEDHLLRAENFFTELDEKERIADCQCDLGLLNYYMGNYQLALEYYISASEYYKKIKHPKEYIDLVNRIAMTYWVMGINDKALQYMIDYLGLLDAGNFKALAIGHNNTGAIYKDLGKLDKALDYYRKAVYYYTVINDSINATSSYTNIGTIYASQNLNDSALYYYNKALKISDSWGNQLQSAKTKHNIALIYYKDGDLDKAKRLLLEFYNMSREIGYKEGVAQAGMSLGDIEHSSNNFASAINYYQQATSLADSIKLSNILINGHLKLSEIYEENKQFSKALFHFQQYSEIKDTVYNSDKVRLITELETRYETEKKEQENRLLIIENELKDRKIRILHLVLGACLLIIMSIVLLTIQYRKITHGRKKLAESESARLADKVEYQKRELANSALALSRNLSFLNKLLEDLKSLSSHMDEKSIQTLRDIIRNIQHLDTDPAWSEFEMRFQKVHARFYDKLTNEFPTLTTNEMRLCALIKLGMNTKEISSVTFQNIRAIEAARLRLRKKLHLDGNEDLGAFLQKI
jgi:tetratricopeptide (TPR) repeat protein